MSLAAAELRSLSFSLDSSLVEVALLEPLMAWVSELTETLVAEHLYSRTSEAVEIPAGVCLTVVVSHPTKPTAAVDNSSPKPQLFARHEPFSLPCQC